MSTNGDDKDKHFHASDGDDEPAANQTQQETHSRPETPSDNASDRSSSASSDDATGYATITSVAERAKQAEEPVIDVQQTEVASELIVVEHLEIKASPVPCRPSRVKVNGSGLLGGSLGQLLTFHIDATNGGPGQLSAFCTGPNLMAYCELLDHSDGTYSLNAKPEETGDHVLQVEYEGEAVPGSPFSFPVTANRTDVDVTMVKTSPVPCRPSRVEVTGSGLSGGSLGQLLTFHIDATNGGPGELTAYCTGPSRLAYCELLDLGNGTFTLTVKAEETGDHVLQVKYQGEPVLGSPFIIPVTAPSSRPDAKRVQVSGPGIENGVLSTFHSNFAVNTKGAGPGNLTIRMQGPKGAYRMEMSRMKRGDRTVFCHYNPTTSGVYVIIVKWSNVDVPGSPFRVQIFDHPDEMDKDLRRQN